MTEHTILSEERNLDLKVDSIKFPIARKMEKWENK